MYNTILGQSLHYGQAMQPGKGKKPINRAIKKKAKEPAKPSNLKAAILMGVK